METDNVYEDFYINRETFDFSGYPFNSKFYDVKKQHNRKNER